MAAEIDNVGDNNVQAAGFVSSTIVKSEGLCSARVSHPLHSRMLLELEARLTYRRKCIAKGLGIIDILHSRV